MTIEEAKKLKVGDRVEWSCIKVDTGTVTEMRDRGVRIRWDSTEDICNIYFNDGGMISCVSLIESEGLQRARKYKVGDRVQYVTNGNGIWAGRVISRDSESVSFSFDNHGSATWRFEFPSLMWDSVTLAPEPTPLEKMTQERDNLQAALEASEKMKNELAQKLETRMNEYISYEKYCQMKTRLAHTDSAYRERDEAREALEHANKNIEDLSRRLDGVNEAMVALKSWAWGRIKTAERELRDLKGTNWYDVAAQHARNETYYRDLVLQCAEVLGPEKFVCDDGTVVPDVLVAKVPELIRKLVLTAADDKSKLEAVMCALEQARQRTHPVSINGVYLFSTFNPEIAQADAAKEAVFPKVSFIEILRSDLEFRRNRACTDLKLNALHAQLDEVVESFRQAGWRVTVS